MNWPTPVAFVWYGEDEYQMVVRKALDPFDEAVQLRVIAWRERVLERRTRDALAKAWG